MRLRREQHTIACMVEIYCRGNHRGGEAPCAECRTLLSYAQNRIDLCRYGRNKPVCTKCTVHCFRPKMRTMVREVMRYAGPRMVICHPVLALLHIVDFLRSLRQVAR